MVTVIDFLVQLGGSILKLVEIFFVDVAFNSVLGFVVFLMGAAFVLASVGVLGYLALGALGTEIGLVTATPNRPPDADGRR